MNINHGHKLLTQITDLTDLVGGVSHVKGKEFSQENSCIFKKIMVSFV